MVVVVVLGSQQLDQSGTDHGSDPTPDDEESDQEGCRHLLVLRIDDLGTEHHGEVTDVTVGDAQQHHEGDVVGLGFERNL